MRADLSLFVAVLFVLSVNGMKKKKNKWAMVREMRENLSELNSQIETLSNPVQIYVHGMNDYHVNNQKKPDQDKVTAEDRVKKEKGTEVHIHFNLPPYPKSSTPEQHASELEEYTYATCDMMRPKHEKQKVIGYVALRQKPSQELEISVNLKGIHVPKKPRLQPGDKRLLHGLHVHQFADFRMGCLSFGGHFNPDRTTHGGQDDAMRHAGDWGNVEVDERGNIRVNMTDSRATLFGPDSIIGRGIVIHEKVDDLGKGNTKASWTTGDAGGRLNCCVIARSQGTNW